MKKKILAKPFYHQLVNVQKIYIEVKNARLSVTEEKEIWDLIEHTIHTRAIDAVLEKLPLEKHEEFLEKFSQQPDDSKLLDYLRQEADDIDNHLRKTFAKLEKEILEDLSG